MTRTKTDTTDGETITPVKQTKKTMLEMTPIDEVLLGKMREIYKEYTGLQISAVIAQIRSEINVNEELERRRELLAQLGIKN